MSTADDKRPATDETPQPPFFFDEFFADPTDAGMPLELSIAGRRVPIRIKRGLTNADRSAAEMAALRRQTMPNGQMKVLGIDEGRLTDELVLRAIVSWPFVQRDGTPVRITKENLAMLKGGAEDIMVAIAAFDKEGEAALATFPRESAPAASGTADEAESAADADDSSR